MQNNKIPAISHNIQNLQCAIVKLSPSIDSNKEKYIATISFKQPLDLAKQYDLVQPALFHNTLINMNSKKRDFYYHFKQDLLIELKKQNLNRATLPWPYIKKQFWKHNAGFNHENKSNL